MNGLKYPGYNYPQFPAFQYDRNKVAHCMKTPMLPAYMMYTTLIEPQFNEHLLQYKGLMVVITTTVGKLVGILEDVFIDHITVMVNEKRHYIRRSGIVYFEKAEEK
ncbi:DUF2642 domain-containing protein [Paenibacillus illinoisensis]|uniref:DUF2642 domain-containing protein n=1 Tax=Paenibacillus illinoisensis TaxID=59845 RepID=UPI00301E2264